MLYLQALLSRGVLLILEACGSLEILKPRLFVTSFPLTLECLYKEYSSGGGWLKATLVFLWSKP